MTNVEEREIMGLP
ncbi:hypothetical protein Forpi1262_v008085 [Fusarium oxysporum f. sp. raphani]|uniref:Uncharacterized protein n=1 Tax=Fusarium oxysporum f. sp. raphani TaxID=96318 RepID=A0A8J5QCC4_FUSOX|nr:hypothetical protein Forpi1262_v008085 [Fusarium oxysporum f. sp. raphani]